MNIFTNEILDKVAEVLEALPPGTYIPASVVAQNIGLTENHKLLFPFLLQEDRFKGRFESVKAKGIRKANKVAALA